MDDTDLFLRDYILSKKWLSKHTADTAVKLKGKKGTAEVEAIDE